MQITGVTEEEFRHYVRTVSRECYDDNLIVKDITDHYGKRRPRITASLCTIEGKGDEQWSSAPGARKSWSGRRGPYACWHAFRDVLNVMFEATPDAVVIAGVHWRVKYDGLDGFRDVYPSTAYKNIGSQFAPAHMPDLCECSGNNTPFSAPPAYVIQFPL